MTHSMVAPRCQASDGARQDVPVHVRPIQHFDDLQGLGGAWDALIMRSRRATPFSSAGWNLACWQHLGRGRLLCLAFEQGTSLVGVAPLYLEPGPRRRLRWIGMLAPRDWRGYPISDYADVVADPDLEVEIADAFRVWLDQNRSFWRTLDLRLLPADGVLARYANDHGGTTQLGASLLMELPQSWPEYVRMVSTNMRPALERIPRKLVRGRDARFERITATHQLQHAMRELFRLHTARWEAEGQSGVFSTSILRSLTGEAMSRFLDLGWLELWLLHIDGEVAAAQLNVRLHDTLYYWISGYAPGRHDLYSPGRTLMAHTIRTAIEERVRTYDFLRGDHAYKRRFGAVAVPQFAVQDHSGPLAHIGLGTWDAGLRLARRAYRAARAAPRSPS